MKIQKTKWKHFLFARSHRNRSLLKRSFDVWQQEIDHLNERKRIFYQACRIGSRLYTRIYLKRWIFFLRMRKRLLMKVEKKHQQLQLKSLRHVFDQWIFILEQQKQFALKTVHGKSLLQVHGRNIKRLHLNKLILRQHKKEHRVEGCHLLGRILKRHFLKIAWKKWTQLTLQTNDHQQQRQRLQKLKISQSIVKWKSFVNTIRQLKEHKRHSYFFLYYRLTKRSMERMRKYCVRKQKERQLVEIILQKTIRSIWSKWKCLLLKNFFFFAWKNFISTKRKITLPNILLYQEFVLNQKKRFKQKVFTQWKRVHWLTQKGRILLQLSIQMVRQKQIPNIFTQWKQQTQILKFVEHKKNTFVYDLIKKVWEKWKMYTRSKILSTHKWRQAVRFDYLQKLKQTFQAIQQNVRFRHKQQLDVWTWILSKQHQTKHRVWIKWSLFLQRQHCVNKMHIHQRKKRVFDSWRVFVRLKKHTQRARLFANKRLIEKMWFFWSVCFVGIEQTRKFENDRKCHLLLTQKSQKIVQYAFSKWKNMYFNKLRKTFFQKEAIKKYHQYLLRNIWKQWQHFLFFHKMSWLLNTKANQHIKMFLQKKIFQKWQKNMKIIQKNRQKLSFVLNYWKKKIEKNFFYQLKKYQFYRLKKRQRIYEAFEWRRHFFQKEAISHWMRAAFERKQQKETNVCLLHAVQTANRWRKIHQIANHWRYITLKRQKEKIHRSGCSSINKKHQQQQRMIPLPHCYYNTMTENRTSNTVTVSREKPMPLSFMANQYQMNNRGVDFPLNVEGKNSDPMLSPSEMAPLTSRITTIGQQYHHLKNSTSGVQIYESDNHSLVSNDLDFCPRERPRPRKPIEFILSTKNLVNVEINGDLSLERQEEQENYARASNLHAQDRVILHSLEKKYGFQFLPYDQGQQQQQEQQESVHHSKPQQHQQLQIRDEPPVTCSSPSSPDSIPTHDLNPVRAVKSITSSPPSVASRTLIPPPSSEPVAPKEMSTVDLEQELRQVESRLLYWKKKQKEWRKFRQDLERSRVELSASLSYDPHSQFALLEMERAYAQQMKEKKASRHEILSLADRLQELNASLGATKV